MRKDGRLPGSIRKVKVKTGYIRYAEGSCLFEMGNTMVVCTASVENGVPMFLRGKGTGWVTSEYGMLPRSCSTRTPRESTKGKKGGRTHEIQRLIGRALRSAVDMGALGERTIWIDCDVIQADGGTRCASITGSFIALCLALSNLRGQGLLEELPLKHFMAAVSVGIVDGQPCLDLNYEEDSRAEVDMNVVMTDADKFIELQGTAEGEAFSKKQADKMISLAKEGIHKLIKEQKKALKGVI